MMAQHYLVDLSLLSEGAASLGNFRIIASSTLGPWPTPTPQEIPKMPHFMPIASGQSTRREWTLGFQ